MRRPALAAAALALPLWLGPAAGAEDASPRTAALELHEDAVPAGPSRAQRLAEIRRRIGEALRYPPLARALDLSGETVVRFRIARDGRARDVSVRRTSGQPLLDAAATRAVVDAGTLPRLRGPLEVPVRFELEAR